MNMIAANRAPILKLIVYRPVESGAWTCERLLQSVVLLERHASELQTLLRKDHQVGVGAAVN